MRFSRVLLPAVLILAPALTAYAAPQHRETTTVEVVQIPVYVTSSGVSVRGLTRDDFTLRVNGRTQKIDYFDIVDFSSLSSEQMRDPRQRRLYVLTFDLASDGSVLYSDGLGISRVGPDGSSERVLKAELIEKVLAL